MGPYDSLRSVLPPRNQESDQHALLLLGHPWMLATMRQLNALAGQVIIYSCDDPRRSYDAISRRLGTGRQLLGRL